MTNPGAGVGDLYGSAGRCPSPSASTTDWSALSLAEILGILGSMQDGNVAGDIAAIRTAIARVRRAMGRLNGEFGSDLMTGGAPDAGVAAAHRLSTAMSTGLAGADAAAAAMDSGRGTIAATRAFEPEMRRLQQHVRTHPEDVPLVRSQVQSMMLGTYSRPMNDAADSLPDAVLTPDELVATDDAGSGTSGAGGDRDADGTRRQAGGSAGAGDLGPSGPSPAGTPSTVQPTNAAAATSGSGPSSGAGAPSGSGGDRRTASGDGPSGLRRAGLGTADVGTRAAALEGRGGAGPRPGSEASTDPGGVPAGPRPLTPPMLTGVAPPTPSTPGAATGAGQRPVGPGTVPPGGARQQSRDRKHVPAHYMHTAEHGREIVGSLPLVGPPVLGDWSPQASPASDDSVRGGSVGGGPVTETGSADGAGRGVDAQRPARDGNRAPH
ncbi:hypothetical protein QSJ18_10360 [Gordonia sp. ABSL1-1]|uniref:hypothetical protein n=1 Tax=Gordonia sp. ABSL1-1 TaxID=3053923 RepID=UPI002574336F|nr:hypothetical protein [Gordonia sp. ABSL1-1]MDL9937145.1 hypothetical protein [Gordonia sp. ABSL1-1]